MHGTNEECYKHVSKKAPVISLSHPPMDLLSVGVLIPLILTAVTFTKPMKLSDQYQVVLTFLVLCCFHMYRIII
jgi:hypothetical protein